MHSLTYKVCFSRSFLARFKDFAWIDGLFKFGILLYILKLSKTILLCRRVKELDLNHLGNSSEHFIASKGEDDSSGRFMADAKEKYEEYAFDLKLMLNRLGLEREEELFLGQAVNPDRLFEANRGRLKMVTFKIFFFHFKFSQVM